MGAYVSFIDFNVDTTNGLDVGSGCGGVSSKKVTKN